MVTVVQQDIQGIGSKDWEKVEVNYIPASELNMRLATNPHNFFTFSTRYGQWVGPYWRLTMAYIWTGIHPQCWITSQYHQKHNDVWQATNNLEQSTDNCSIVKERCQCLLSVYYNSATCSLVGLFLLTSVLKAQSKLYASQSSKGVDCQAWIWRFKPSRERVKNVGLSEGGERNGGIW